MLLLGTALLTACGSNHENLGNSGNGKGNSDNGITADEELVITASNYSFDQQEYHLKKGVPVKIIFKNESGNHGILAPGLELHLDGKKSSQVIVPEEAGTFEISCSIMCGSGHSGMQANFIVD
ncbi:cytochrome C oxidase subunit II [Paenibacillus donghaensis]|uniref:Cytochrome C oxidase subunit II n=2 Tax=Paenibacillus donghaensis TaxID=414771 RepID=A0A2Z2K9B4_9BACL|nr:cytochrome C oxidase subunit II [Paenibacillus donghaensis]